MGQSGDLELLEKQVSLLRDLLANLDGRRDARRKEALSSARSSPEPAATPETNPAPQREPTGKEEAGPGARLRLVGEDIASPERRPRFREKRSWNLSPASRAGPEEQPPGEAERGPDPAMQGSPPSSDRPSEAEPVPWRAFEQILRDRDDLLVQLVRQQAAEQRLLEVLAAEEGKDEEIDRLRNQLRDTEAARFDGMMKRLHQRLAEAEELQKVVIQRALQPQPAPATARATTGVQAMSGRPETGAGKKFWIRGHEVVVATSRQRQGGFYSFALLTLDVDGSSVMKGFKARGGASREAELACIDRVLTYLEEQASGKQEARPRSSRNLARIRGREIDIFCDLVGPENFQAFPFLYDDSGRRHILLRFHLDEAITADTAEEARLRCVRRLEAYFDEEDGNAGGTVAG